MTKPKQDPEMEKELRRFRGFVEAWIEKRPRARHDYHHILREIGLVRGQIKKEMGQCQTIQNRSR